MSIRKGDIYINKTTGTILKIIELDSRIYEKFGHNHWLAKNLSKVDTIDSDCVFAEHSMECWILLEDNELNKILFA